MHQLGPQTSTLVKLLWLLFKKRVKTTFYAQVFRRPKRFIHFNSWCFHSVSMQTMCGINEKPWNHSCKMERWLKSEIGLLADTLPLDKKYCFRTSQFPANCKRTHSHCYGFLSFRHFLTPLRSFAWPTPPLPLAPRVKGNLIAMKARNCSQYEEANVYSNRQRTLESGSSPDGHLQQELRFQNTATYADNVHY